MLFSYSKIDDLHEIIKKQGHQMCYPCFLLFQTVRLLNLFLNFIKIFVS